MINAQVKTTIGNQPEKRIYRRVSGLVVLLCFIGILFSYGINPAATGSKENPEADERIKQLIGSVPPDLEDSTLLQLVYGSCTRAGEKSGFKLCPKMWSENDSVFMEVKERLGDDTTQVIYIRGENAITAVMHNFYYETALLFHKKPGGRWTITGGYTDREVIDYSSVELAGKLRGKLLIKYQTSGVYAGGVQFAAVSYAFFQADGTEKPEVSFITDASNTASTQCMASENGNECNCYTREGQVTYYYDNKLACFVFNYSFANTLYDCDVKNGQTKKATQTWYMNNDTALFVNGNSISTFGETIGPKTALPETKIREILKLK